MLATWCTMSSNIAFEMPAADSAHTTLLASSLTFFAPLRGFDLHAQAVTSPILQKAGF